MYWPDTPFEKNQELYEHLKNDFINSQSISELGLELCEARFQTLQKRLCFPPAFTTIRLGMNMDPKDAVENILQQTRKNSLVPDIFIHPTLCDLLLVKSPHPFPDFSVLPKGKEVIVGLQCGEAVLRGAPVFMAGILAVPSGLTSGDSVSIYVDLDGRCLKGSKKHFDGRKVFVGNGKSLVSRNDLFRTAQPRGVGIEVTEPVCDCPPSTLLQVGTLQNLPSVVCAHVLDPHSSHWVIDLCAAPGGKTTHIGTLMSDKGVLVAIDKTSPRVSKLRKTVAASALTNIYCFVYDATKCIDLHKTSKEADLLRSTADNMKSSSLEDILHPPYPPELFDRVLLDAPCSGLGRRPQLANKITVNEVRSYPALQRKLFSTAVKLLRIGGILVYSTCTLTLAENEEIIAWALEEFHELSLEEQVPSFGEPGMPCKNLSRVDQMKLQRFNLAVEEDTSFNTDTIGFFIAKFIKKVP